MNKKILVLTVMAAMASATAVRADFHGKWSGKGHVTDTAGWIADCTKMHLSFVQTPEELYFKDGHFKCANMDSYWESVHLEIRDGGDLYHMDEKVGWIKLDEMQMTYTDPNDRTLYLSMKLVGGKLIYREIHKSVGGVMTFKATFK
jgi:hypothetical protein